MDQRHALQPAVLHAPEPPGGRGSWPGTPDAKTDFSQTYAIDYVRVFKRAVAARASGWSRRGSPRRDQSHLQGRTTAWPSRPSRARHRPAVVARPPWSRSWWWWPSSPAAWSRCACAAAPPPSTTDLRRRLVWSDDFTGTGLSTASWDPLHLSTFGDGNEELACLTDRAQNLSLSDGSLVLTARREQPPLQCGSSDDRFPGRDGRSTPPPSSPPRACGPGSTRASRSVPRSRSHPASPRACGRRSGCVPRTSRRASSTSFEGLGSGDSSPATLHQTIHYPQQRQDPAANPIRSTCPTGRPDAVPHLRDGRPRRPGRLVGRRHGHLLRWRRPGPRPRRHPRQALVPAAQPRGRRQLARGPMSATELPASMRLMGSRSISADGDRSVTLGPPIGRSPDRPVTAYPRDSPPPGSATGPTHGRPGVTCERPARRDPDRGRTAGDRGGPHQGPPGADDAGRPAHRRPGLRRPDHRSPPSSSTAREPTEIEVETPANRTIRTLTNERKPGLAGNRNTGITHAQGAYLGHCDDDDEWLPSKVTNQVAILQARPDATGTRDLRTTVCYQGIDTPRPGSGTDLHLEDFLLSRRAEVHSSTFFFERSMLDRIGFVDEDLPAATPRTTSSCCAPAASARSSARPSRRPHPLPRRGPSSPASGR